MAGESAERATLIVQEFSQHLLRNIFLRSRIEPTGCSHSADQSRDQI